MRIATAVRKLRKHKPKNRSEFQKLFRLHFIGSGCFREVYRLLDVPMVVKFPKNDGCARRYRDSSVHHTRMEIDRFRRLRRKGRLLKHLPEIFYTDKKNAIIVMREYLANSQEREQTAEFDILQKKIHKYCRAVDTHRRNILLDANGVFKITDVGC